MTTWGDVPPGPAAARPPWGRVAAALLATVAALSIACGRPQNARAANPYPQVAELTASDGAQNDRLGFFQSSVAISGTTIVAGAPYHKVGSNANQGEAYVFSGAAGWAQIGMLTADDGQAQDLFGKAVAIDGSTIVVGAPAHEDGTTFSEGAAYVFTNTSGSWHQVAKLVPNNGATSDTFGTSVAITGSTIVVGAPAHGGYADGAVYVFTLAGGTWTQTAELDGSGTSQAVGQDVAVSGTTIATANENVPSSVHVYSGLTGTPTQVGDVSEPQVTSLAISGSTIVAGASQDNMSMGDAFVINGSGGTWAQTQTLTASPAVTAADPGDFGVAVGISGNTIAVGAPTNTVGTTSIQGTVFVYTRPSGGSFTQAAALTATTGAPEWTGSGLALAGGLIAAGTGDTKVGANTFQGAVYVFGGAPTYAVSGKVLGTACSDTSCTLPGGIGGFTVLVKGTASDGTAVSQTAVSGADGTWLVNMPPGSYTAGLSADGVSFVSPAMEQAVKVTTAAVAGVDFTSCAGESSSTGAARLSPDDPFAAAEAEGSFTASYCESEYTLKLTAKIPQPILVDASKNAHFNTTNDNGSHGFNHSPTFLNGLRERFHQAAGFNEEYPDCMRPGQVALFTREKAKAEWFSYIDAGKVIGSTTVKFIWNQTTQKAELAGTPTETAPASLTRKFVWRVALASGKVLDGKCSDKAKVPMLIAVQPSGSGEGATAEIAHAEDGAGPAGGKFTIEAGWWLPFDDYGAQIDRDTPLAEKIVDSGLELVKGLFKGGGKLLEAYEHLPASVRFVIETGVTLAIGAAEEKLIVKGAVETADFYKQYSAGSRLTEKELEQLEVIGAVKGFVEHFIQIPLEAYGIYTGYFGYPVFSSVIRGQFKTTKYLPSAEVSPVRAMPYQTTLSVAAQTTKFPTFSLEVSRDALNTCLSGCHVWEGPLPWASSPVGEPETFNPFSTKNGPYVIEDSTKTDHSYTSGFQAVKNVESDTNQNTELAFSIRHKGNITSGFAAAQDDLPAPSCDADSGHSNSLQTICWIFSDWRP